MACSTGAETIEGAYGVSPAEEGDQWSWLVGEEVPTEQALRVAVSRAELEEMLEDDPRVKVGVSREVKHALVLGDVDTGITLAEHAERVGWFRSVLERLNLNTVVPAEAMCGEDAFCPAVVEGRSNYRDNHHVSAHAAGKLTPLLVDALRESGVGRG